MRASKSCRLGSAVAAQPLTEIRKADVIRITFMVFKCQLRTEGYGVVNAIYPLMSCSASEMASSGTIFGFFPVRALIRAAAFDDCCASGRPASNSGSIQKTLAPRSEGSITTLLGLG